MTDNFGRPRQIHVVEDTQADFLALRRALASASLSVGVEIEIVHHSSAEEAYGAVRAGALPDLMLIDLHLSGESGLRLLARLRDKTFPKVLLTSSALESDIEASYRDGAAGYLTKPLGYDELKRSVEMLVQEWLGPEPYLPLAQ